MDSLQEILGKKDFTPPDEVAVVKEYVLRRYNSKCSVKLERQVIIVRVPSSALAATLQLERHQIAKSLGLIDKELVIRNGL